MPTDRPTAEELLQAIDGFLQDCVAPQLDGRNLFHLKVTRNLLALLQREWTQGAEVRQQELRRLQRLLDSDSTDLEALNRRLCDAIRNGAFALDDPALQTHLQATARAKLAIDNPRHAPGR